MTGSVSLLPSQSGYTLATPTVPGLTDAEQALVTGLSHKLTLRAEAMRLRWLYYDGLQPLVNLGMSIPEQLAGVRTVVDWPRVCCDPLVMRAEFAGFRMPNATEVDDDLAAHFVANDMASELPLAFLDSLVAGIGYMIVGSPDEPGESPIITVESPLNLATMWDARTRQVTAAFQSYSVDGQQRAALYLPDQTMSMAREQEYGPWKVTDRDQHRLGEVPVVRMPNRSRSSDRDGRSEITAAVMNTTDAAVRALLGMDIAREVYSIPRMAILGASEGNFQRPDGTRRTPLELAMTHIMALERDEEGELPELKQLTAFDPSVFTKIIDEHAQLMASFTGFPPSYFGQTTTANPASADAIRVAMNGIDRRGQQVCRQATAPLRKTGQLVWRFANNGRALTDELKRLETDWMDASTPTPAATTDAITKQVSVGAIPATSDVTLQALGYSPLQRKRLEQDRKLNPSEQLESELTSSTAARRTRAGNALANVLERAAETAASTPTEPPPGQAGR